MAVLDRFFDSHQMKGTNVTSGVHDIVIYRVGKNPYPHTISNEEFWNGINNVVIGGSRLVPFDGGFGLVVLDPTKQHWVPSIQSVLFMATIGEVGDHFLPNALTKVCWHRDHMTDYGHMVHNQPHRLPDGCFRYSGSVEVDRTYVGGSGLEDYDDRALCTLVANGFNNFVAERRAIWAKTHPLEGAGEYYSWWYEVPGPTSSVVHAVEELKCECYKDDIVSFSA